VSPTQLNVQVPWELQGQASVQIKVTIDFSPGNVVTVPVVSVAPAIFAFTDSGLKAQTAAALDESNRVVTSGNPVVRGHVAQLFVNALGPVSNTPATGSPAPASPLASAVTTPSVTIGGQPAVVQFSGLAPGFSGLYQVNVVVPQNIGTGPQAVVISSGGLSSPPVNISVQ
jgi:minor extracellular serine protease Vpr